MDTIIFGIVIFAILVGGPIAIGHLIAGIKQVDSDDHF